MSWYAKPSGSYSITSFEGKENILEMRNFLLQREYTNEAITGVIANSVYEGGLNPWRWESDIYPPTSSSKGCGLFGFTPYSRYLSLDGSDKMNLSVTGVTPNASSLVGNQQMEIMADGTWGWVSTCWRTYWSTTTYADQYQLSRRILSQYGANNRLSQFQYSRINSISDAVFAFLACFEGPNIPNYEARLSVANDIYQIITDNPPQPTYKKQCMPVYMMIRRWI